MNLVSLLALMVAGQPAMPSISIPYQAVPAFMAYTQCVDGGFSRDPRSQSDDAAQLRQANLDATAACREVRTEQLTRGLAAVADRNSPITPNYKNRADAEAAVVRAFDRFDADVVIEAAPAGTDNASN